MIVKSFTKNQIIELTGSAKISPSVQITDYCITMEIASSEEGYAELQMNSGGSDTNFSTLSQFEKIVLPALVTISDCTIGNSIRVVSTVDIDKITFNH